MNDLYSPETVERGGVGATSTIDSFYDSLRRGVERGAVDIQEEGGLPDAIVENMQPGYVYDHPEHGYIAKTEEGAVVAVDPKTKTATTTVVKPAPAKPAAPTVQGLNQAQVDALIKSRMGALPKPANASVPMFHVANGRIESFEAQLNKDLFHANVEDAIRDRLRDFSVLSKETGTYVAGDGSSNTLASNCPAKTPVATIVISGSDLDVRPNARFEITVVKALFKNGVDASGGVLDEISTTMVIRPLKFKEEVIIVIPAVKRVGAANFMTNFEPAGGGISACSITVVGVQGLSTEINWDGCAGQGFQYLANQVGLGALVPAR